MPPPVPQKSAGPQFNHRENGRLQQELTKAPVSKNDILRIAVVGGDGTGPEVTAEAVKVFKAVAALEGIRYELKDFDLGGERFLRTGEILPEDVVAELATFKAVLLGAVGHPDV